MHMFAQQLTAMSVTYRRYVRSLVVGLGWRSDSVVFPTRLVIGFSYVAVCLLFSSLFFISCCTYTTSS